MRARPPSRIAGDRLGAALQGAGAWICRCGAFDAAGPRDHRRWRRLWADPRPARAPAGFECLDHPVIAGRPEPRGAARARASRLSGHPADPLGLRSVSARPSRPRRNRGGDLVQSLFRLDETLTTVRIEIVAGATTYLTMAYIVFVNPLILANAGMDRGAVFVATCLASAFATLLMALFANYPLALAPGMGMNAYFAYSVVKGLHYTWEVALGAVFLSGVLFLILSLARMRLWIVGEIPLSQKRAIAAGI